MLLKSVKRIDRRFVNSQILKRKNKLPKLFSLSKTKKGREENFGNVLRILLTFKVETADELFEGLELVTKKKRIHEIHRLFYNLYNKPMKRKRLNKKI